MLQLMGAPMDQQQRQQQLLALQVPPGLTISGPAVTPHALLQPLGGAQATERGSTAEMPMLLNLGGPRAPLSECRLGIAP